MQNDFKENNSIMDQSEEENLHNSHRNDKKLESEINKMTRPLVIPSSDEIVCPFSEDLTMSIFDLLTTRIFR